jgi:hypothetical protein
MVYKYHGDRDTITNDVRLFEFMKNHWFQLFQILKEPLSLGYFKNLKEITSFGYFKNLKEPLSLVISKPAKNLLLS